jgi:hypothetical protein
MITPENFTTVSNDVNGNPRYVLHWIHIHNCNSYIDALNVCHVLGGKKFHNKQFGGGIVFTTYNLLGLCEKINKMLDNTPRSI